MTLTFARFLRTPELSGPEWQKPTRAPWHALAKALSGERLTRAEVALVKAATGLERVPRNVRLLIGLIGRRGGKSAFLAAFAVWVAVFAADWTKLLSPGERGVVLLLAPSRRQAAILARYAAAIAGGPLIADEVLRQTADEIEFANGAVIEVGVSDWRTVRGRTILATIFDEACFAAEEGASPIEEVVSAAEPGMATVPGGGWLVLSSSPWKPKGLVHRRWKELRGNQAGCDAVGALCWVAASRTMNPTLSEAYVARKVSEDPAKNRAEYVVDPESPWRTTDADFCPDDAIDACTDWGALERPPLPGVRYVGFTDGAGGTGTDAFTLGIAYLDDLGRPVLAAARERRPRFVPFAVAEEYAALLKTYSVTEVHGDHWAGGYVRADYARHGIEYKSSTRTKSEIYISGLPLLLSGKARLLDLPRLRSQLSALDRKVGTGGRESVDASGPEDLANAAMGALVLAADRVETFVARSHSFAWG